MDICGLRPLREGCRHPDASSRACGTARSRCAPMGSQREIIRHDAYISVPVKGSVLIGGRTLRAITHSFSRSSPPGGLTAPVADLGARDRRCFRRDRRTGKIVLIDGIANPAAGARASAGGGSRPDPCQPARAPATRCASPPVWGAQRMRPSLACRAPSIVQIPSTRGRRARGAHGRPGLAMTLHAEVDTGWRKTPILVADLMPGPDG